jgi:hypothetical protein
VVTLQGQTLCGPCKNFRIRGLNRPARLSPLAIVSLILALVCTLVAVILTFLAIGLTVASENGVYGSVIACFVAMILAAAELIVGWMALRQIERQANLGGRALAMTGMTAGATGVLWSLSIAILSIAKQWQG